MPTNRFISLGILILAASVLLWMGAQLTKLIEWILPYTAGVGIVLIVGAAIWESWHAKKTEPPKSTVTSDPLPPRPDAHER